MFSFIRGSQNGYLQGGIFPFNIVLKRLVHSLRQRRCGLEFAVKKWDLGSYKHSDTLFILGSGGSIASYTPHQWDEINKHDSVGFNFWLLHEYVPTYFTAEILPDSIRSEVFWQNLKGRARDYRDVPVIFKYSQAFWESRRSIPHELSEIFIATHISIPGFRKKAFVKWLRCLHWLGVFTQRWASGLIFFRQASLSWLITFALQLGYKKIVLCGVDLNSGDYFYELAPQFYKKRGLHAPPEEYTTLIHPSNDAKYCRGGLPIGEVLKSMNEEILVKRNVKLFVGAKSSALYPEIPLYNWEAGYEVQ